MQRFWLVVALFQMAITLGFILPPSYAIQDVPGYQPNATDQMPVPPLKQIKNEGVSFDDVTCPHGMTLMKKSFDDSPACVMPNTAQKLVNRGWGVVVKLPVPELTSTVSSYTIGQRVGVFTITVINPNNVTGFYNNPYPIERPGPGVPTTMFVGSTLNPTCDGSAPLIITSINYPSSISVGTGKSNGSHIGGCPICLSADSIISTPNGDVNVRDIRDGMTVWSTDPNGDVIKSKIIKTGHVFVGYNHKVIDLRLADGRELFVSANHPTFDGGKIGDLAKGERYDGSTVVSSSLVHYQYQYTYDILPDSQTGDYFADGILVGSTLK